MSKYIDADALMDELNNQFRDMDNNVYDSQDDALEDAEVSVRQIIHNMPAADVEPVRKWISVNERLPETRVDKEYRGGIFAGEPREVIEHTVSDQVLVAIEDWYNRIIIEIDFICDGEWDNYGERDVIAWMPLPESPKMDGGSE